MPQDAVRHYGVREQAQASSAEDASAEAIQLIGYTVVDGGYSHAEITAFSQAFDDAYAAAQDRHGRERLVTLGEQNTVRALLAENELFLSLALENRALSICRRMMGDYIVLNQQNGVVSPAMAASFTQDAFHRDLPYQHFVSSRPISMSAMFCIDTFTQENGATVVLPGSHKSERFPSDETARALAHGVSASAGSFIVFDSMLYHKGGVNGTGKPRRGVNHMYTIPLLRQQIDIPAMLGQRAFDADTRRLLGYDVMTPRDVAGFYAARCDKGTA